jgi:hypothetical protein
MKTAKPNSASLLRKIKTLVESPKRPFIEALSLKTPLTEEEMNSRIDPSSQTYRLVTSREGVNYDL